MNCSVEYGDVSQYDDGLYGVIISVEGGEVVRHGDIGDVRYDYMRLDMLCVV